MTASVARAETHSAVIFSGLLYSRVRLENVQSAFNWFAPVSLRK